MNQRDAIHYIATRQEFQASALSGRFERFTPQSGRLDPEEQAIMAKWAGGIGGLYVVYSYGTPICWASLEGWYVVSQKFSQTTSKHQNLTRRAIAESLEGASK
jgi:hypothetical protein